MSKPRINKTIDIKIRTEAQVINEQNALQPIGCGKDAFLCHLYFL